jgi:hypothetical protein
VKPLKLDGIENFCEDIGKVVMSVNVGKFEVTRVNMLMEEVVFNINVFDPLVKGRVL